MSFYEDRILPRVVDVFLDNKDLSPYRERACADLSGVVVEIGFGSGLNVPFYPPDVERVLAVDPAQLGRELAANRLEASSVDVDFVGLDGESLPIDDASVDAALATFTLCTIPDADQALSELRRVLKPGGKFFFVEHGRAEAMRSRRRQDRINPAWKRVAGGCNLNRPMDELIRNAGFSDISIDRSIVGNAVAGGAVAGSIYCGEATR